MTYGQERWPLATVTAAAMLFGGRVDDAPALAAAAAAPAKDGAQMRHATTATLRATEHVLSPHYLQAPIATWR